MDLLNTQRRDFINTVLNINPNIIIVIDKKNKIIYANDKASSVFNIISEQIIGIDFSQIFPKIDFEHIIYGNSSFLEEVIVKDAVKREFLFTAVDINIKGNFNGYVISLTNIVDIQKKERKVRQSLYENGKITFFSFSDIVGESPAIKQARQMGIQFAESDSPVLLLGDTGTGKEMFAQAIHVQSKRRESAFISINCAAVPENLLESELFGYEEGAFTGARRGGKTGLFELAHGGTLFLDEIGEMPLRLQSRLLRVLQDKVVTRLGSTRFVHVNVRIICATNRNIFDMANRGDFRRDLFYRINTLLLKIPPLSARKEDIRVIVHSYLRKINESRQKKVIMARSAIKKLEHNSWPGNVRELLHVVDRAVVMAMHPVISAEDILFDADILGDVGSSLSDLGTGGQGECADLQEVLQKCKYNKTLAAEALGISRTTLWRRMKECGL